MERCIAVPFCTRTQLRMIMPNSGYSNCADSASGFEKVELAGIAFVFKKVMAFCSGLKDARGFLSLTKNHPVDHDSNSFGHALLEVSPLNFPSGRTKEARCRNYCLEIPSSLHEGNGRFFRV